MTDHARWVGTDEHGGVPSQRRADVQPPSGWRLDAIAATERARSLAVSPDAGSLAYIHDRDGSDVWVTSLGPAAGTPRRLTTTRPPAPYWEDTAVSWSPDGARLAFSDDGWVTVVPSAGGVPVRVTEASDPVWVDDRTLLAVAERDRRSLIVRCSCDDAWPVPVASHPEGDAYGPVVAPDRRHVVYTVWRHDDLDRRELWITPVDPVARDEARLVAELPGLLDGGPAFSADGTRIAYTAQVTDWCELYVVPADGSSSPRMVTSTEADLGPLAWHASGATIASCRTRRGRSELVVIDVDSGTVEVVAGGGTWAEPVWAGDDLVATYEDHRVPPRVELVTPATQDRRVLLAPTPASILVAPHVTPEELVFPSADGREVHAFLYRPADAEREGTAPVPAIVHVHGGPAAVSGDEWDGVVQYFVAKGYAWCSVNVRGSTGYGREHERANHGDWGGGDVRDVLAAHDALAALGWVDAARVAVYGPSYGSYLALCAVAMDPAHRYAAAICKYGDCDILTSWSQGDRGGVIEQERMLGRPRAENRRLYEIGSPYHQLEHVEVPILVAHGERDERVSPQQSAQLVSRLRELGKRYEYVTYPTEAHGFLRPGPFLHFWQRFERFLDWHLM
ncbi:MAG: prolyl oligopeptidase family serine peptidase [Acidimicrobiia bacterium]